MNAHVKTSNQISSIQEAFGSLDTALESLPVWEIDLSVLEETIRAFTFSLQESDDLVKGIPCICSESPVLAFHACPEGYHHVQKLLVMTIHFRSDYSEYNSCHLISLNYITINRALWT